MFESWVKFVAEIVTGTTTTGAGGVATLSHEVSDDAVEDSVIVVAFAREEDEIVDCIGHFNCEKCYLDVAFVCFECGSVFFREIQAEIRGFNPLFLCHDSLLVVNFIRG